MIRTAKPFQRIRHIVSKVMYHATALKPVSAAVIPSAAAGSQAAEELGSTDDNYANDRIDKRLGEKNTRDFTYFILGNDRMIFASLARLAVIKVRFHYCYNYQYNFTKNNNKQILLLFSASPI